MINVGDIVIVTKRIKHANQSISFKGVVLKVYDSDRFCVRVLKETNLVNYKKILRSWSRLTGTMNHVYYYVRREDKFHKIGSCDKFIYNVAPTKAFVYATRNGLAHRSYTKTYESSVSEVYVYDSKVNSIVPSFVLFVDPKKDQSAVAVLKENETISKATVRAYKMMQICELSRELGVNIW